MDRETQQAWQRVAAAWNTMIPPQRQIALNNVRAAVGAISSERQILHGAINKYPFLWPAANAPTGVGWSELPEALQGLLGVLYDPRTRLFTNTTRLNQVVRLSFQEEQARAENSHVAPIG